MVNFGRFNRGSEGISQQTEEQRREALEAQAERAKAAQARQAAQKAQISKLGQRVDRGAPVKQGETMTVNGKQYKSITPDRSWQAEQARKAAAEAAAKQAATSLKTVKQNTAVYNGLTNSNPSTSYSIADSVASIYSQAKSYGVSQYQGNTIFGSEAEAQAAIDSYLGTANKGLQSYYDSQPITILDSLGREQKVTKSQYEQMTKAQKSADKYSNYSLLPEEVANSGADWWINSNGLYEWVPVTAGDKAELAKENKQRAQFHQAAKTTLTTGAVWSDSFSNEWYSTGGGNRGKGESGVKLLSSSGAIKQTYDYSTINLAQVGSGDTKLAELKASSPINNSSSAITGTAQTQKVTIIKPVAEEPKKAETKTSPTSISILSLTDSPSALNLDSLLTKKATVDTFKGVSDIELISNRKTTSGATNALTGLGIIDKNTNQKIKEASKSTKTSNPDSLSFKMNDVLGKTGTAATNLLDSGNKVLSKQAAPLFNELESLKADYDKALKSTSVSFTDKGISISKKGNEPISALLSYNAKGAQDKIINSNGILKGTKEFLNDEYSGWKEKPLSKGLEYGSYYVGGEVFGIATKGAKVLSSPLGKSAAKKLTSGTVGLMEKTSSPIIKKGIAKAGTAAASRLETGTIIDTAMMVGLGSEIIKTGSEGYSKGGTAGATKNLLNTGKALVIGAPGYKKGDLIAGRVAQGDLTAAVPVLKSAKISELAGKGSDQQPIDLSFGYTLAPLNKPLISYTKGTGLKLGAVGAPKEAITGKTTQAFNKLETEFFKKTVKTAAGETETSYLQSALNIEKGAVATKRPITKVNTFEITSKGIPETARAPIKEAIIDYKGSVTVAGSVPMKAQADPFVTRTPHDLELYADNAEAVTASIVTNLKKSGLVEGIDFKPDGTKVQFKLLEDGKEKWDTGIEAFTHGEKTESAKAIDDILYGIKKSSESDSPVPSKKLDSSEIAFGYNSRKPVKIENNKIKIQDLKEQMTRKVAGATQLRDGILQPAHPGRVKDIGDTITMGAAFAIKGKAPIERDVINFTEAAFKKWGSGKDPMSKAFQEAYMGKGKNGKTDPVVSFIHENKKLPTEAELLNLRKDTPDILSTEIYYSKYSKKGKSPKPFDNRSPSPSIFDNRSPSPSIFNNRSPSPSIFNNRSPSPSIFDNRSPSPKPFDNRSPSPTIFDNRSPSPTIFNNRSPSPSIFNNRSPSPSIFDNRSPSPKPFDNRSPSPKPFDNRSPSPTIFDNRSPSPKPFDNRSPSPYIFDNRSPSPYIFDNRSPSPKPPSNNIQDTSNTNGDIAFLEFQNKTKQFQQTTNTGWGHQIKRHYVKDPFEFVLGKKNKRR